MRLVGDLIPDFKTADGPHQADFPGKLGVVAQIGGNEDAALAVQGTFLHPGDEKTLEITEVFAEDRLLGEFGLDLLPLGEGKG